IFFYLNDNTGYVCGNNGVILKTTNGGGAIITGINNTGSFPSEYKLEQNYPNPFNPNTTIDFSIPENGLTRLEVIDINGRSVYTIIDQYLNKGSYSASFNGSDIASGIYYYRLTSNNFSKTNKMILLK
ncbi:MAG TPA: T9SS type A sorting domain-containing protein, partial [Ignavibacteria bacterium]|nr:T9SS type A sorting domain-containing protein [Ignavibacteria bacterium]